MLTTISVFVTLFLVWAVTKVIHKPIPYMTSLKGATDALSHIQEWAKWVSGIQTLAIAALAWFTLEPDCHTIVFSGAFLYYFAALAFVCIGLALFCSAWILASVPSQSIRIHTHSAKGQAYHFDIYEQPLFSGKWPTLGYLLTVNHWYWGVGLISFGLLVLMRLLNL